ncbi:hypothetical protein BDK89_2484 [Ilumatobacter fluminis]|uniref:SalK n=1 Tax=Ilumatobacter fluminis TaxID=467091 RepID=A0A4R7I2V2_9ACTN|nr:hypothetical protein [Ilumatobacter fluminis]TDT16883.1 hypothetical protein BDK89_2484 [Ilumatobacter fluminis]
MDPLIARKTWRTLEPLHGMIYFVPEAAERYAAVGITNDRAGYFASRAAAMGEVLADVVIATFYNFHPDVVRRAIPHAWTEASAVSLLAARLDAVDAALRRALGDLIAGEQIERAATLARQAALVACERPEGRPLFAGHAGLEWPDDPHLILWTAQTMLREFRGDGHIAALTIEGLTGCEALVMHGATGDVPGSVLQSSRAWSDDEWSSTIVGLADRGLVDSAGEFTDEGRAVRQSIEDRTDRLALAPYEALGEERCAELRQLGRPLSRAVVDAGLLVPARLR